MLWMGAAAVSTVAAGVALGFVLLDGGPPEPATVSPGESLRVVLQKPSQAPRRSRKKASSERPSKREAKTKADSETIDPLSELVRELESGHPERIRAALWKASEVGPELRLVEKIVPLLGGSEVNNAATVLIEWADDFGVADSAVGSQEVSVDAEVAARRAAADAFVTHFLTGDQHHRSLLWRLLHSKFLPLTLLKLLPKYTRSERVPDEFELRMLGRLVRENGTALTGVLRTLLEDARDPPEVYHPERRRLLFFLFVATIAAETDEASIEESAKAALDDRALMDLASGYFVRRANVAVVEASLKHASPLRRGVMALACQYFGEVPGSVLERLTVLALDDPEPWVRFSAIETIGTGLASGEGTLADPLVDVVERFVTELDPAKRIRRLDPRQVEARRALVHLAVAVELPNDQRERLGALLTRCVKHLESRMGESYFNSEFHAIVQLLAPWGRALGETRQGTALLKKAFVVVARDNAKETIRESWERRLYWHLAMHLEDSSRKHVRWLRDTLQKPGAHFHGASRDDVALALAIRGASSWKALEELLDHRQLGNAFPAMWSERYDRHPDLVYAESNVLYRRFIDAAAWSEVEVACMNAFQGLGARASHLNRQIHDDFAKARRAGDDSKVNRLSELASYLLPDSARTPFVALTAPEVFENPPPETPTSVRLLLDETPTLLLEALSKRQYDLGSTPERVAACEQVARGFLAESFESDDSLLRLATIVSHGSGAIHDVVLDLLRRPPAHVRALGQTFFEGLRSHASEQRRILDAIVEFCERWMRLPKE